MLNLFQHPVIRGPQNSLFYWILKWRPAGFQDDDNYDKFISGRFPTKTLGNDTNR